MPIRITRNVVHKGRIYNAPAVVSLRAADEKHLIEGGFAEKHTPLKEEPTSPPKPDAEPPAE